MRISLVTLLAAAGFSCSAAPISAGAGVPGVNPLAFRITTFATGLNYATSIAGASAGGLLLAAGWPGTVFRMVDANHDGIADSAGTAVFSVNGPVISMSNAGPFVAVGVLGEGVRLFAPGANPDDPYTNLGVIGIGFAPGQSHSTPGVTTRATPGAPGSYDVFFSVGSPNNNSSGPALAVSGLVSGTVNAESIYKVTLAPNGSGGWNASGLTQVASGLRNAVGLGIHPSTGDLYLADNGIDGLVDSNEPESADTLNRVTAADIAAGNINGFGYPDRYVQYRTGTLINGGPPPLVAFQPTPNPLNGSESEGAAGLAFAPSGFPAPARNGLFVSFFGRGGTADGLANEENPVLFYDVGTGQYHEFISNNEAGVKHPFGLYSSADSLFIVDLGNGSVYQISTVPEPGTLALMAAALSGLVLWRRRA